MRPSSLNPPDQFGQICSTSSMPPSSLLAFPRPTVRFHRRIHTSRTPCTRHKAAHHHDVIGKNLFPHIDSSSLFHRRTGISAGGEAWVRLLKELERHNCAKSMLPLITFQGKTGSGGGMVRRQSESVRVSLWGISRIVDADEIAALPWASLFPQRVLCWTFALRAGSAPPVRPLEDAGSSAPVAQSRPMAERADAKLREQIQASW
jgi:hypothetical protein